MNDEILVRYVCWNILLRIGNRILYSSLLGQRNSNSGATGIIIAIFGGAGMATMGANLFINGLVSRL